MKKIIVALFLCSVSTIALAESNFHHYVKYDANDEIQVTFYYDDFKSGHASFANKDGTREVFQLADSDRDEDIHSWKTDYKVDCKHHRYMVMSVTDFKEHMAGSAPIDHPQEDAGYWQNVNPADSTFKLACK